MSSEGGFFDAARDLNDRLGNLTMSRKPFQDSPTPAGNSVAVIVLDRLAGLAARAGFPRKGRNKRWLCSLRKLLNSACLLRRMGWPCLNHLEPPTKSW